MTKKVKEPPTHEEFEASLKGEAPAKKAFNKDTVALTTVACKDGSYKVLQIEVDSEGMTTGEVKVIETAATKYEAAEKFKLAVVKNGLI